MSLSAEVDLGSGCGEEQRVGGGLDSTASARRILHIRQTTVADGDLAIDSDPVALERHRRAIAPFPWTWLRQVHGTRVVRVPEAGHAAGEEADAAVTSEVEAVLAVQTADCVPIGLYDRSGVIGVAHAGWRGLVGGVVEAAVAEMRAAGAADPVAVLGAAVCAACYEFGAEDLDAVADRYGPSVRAVARSGAPALDVVKAATVALAGCGVRDVARFGGCTSCDGDGRWWSFRARGEGARQALVLWTQVR